MPNGLDVGGHLDGLRAALDAFVRYAGRAGLGAAVPTCPDWTVLDLVAHQGMVHRWAAATLRGEEVEAAAFERAGRAAADPLDWLNAGAAELTTTIRTAPEDAEAFVFLADAPPARRFWARRQCHETTIHAVDALAASLARPPTAADTWITADVALDGIDELLTGFLPRPHSRLRAVEPMNLAVVPSAGEGWWSVAIGPEPAVTTRRTGLPDRQLPHADVTLRGTPTELYLALWNRSAPTSEVVGDDELLTRWRDLVAVRWSR